MNHHLLINFIFSNFSDYCGAAWLPYCKVFSILPASGHFVVSVSNLRIISFNYLLSYCDYLVSLFD